MSRLPAVAAALLAGVAAATPAGALELTPEAALRRAIEHSPTLSAAALELERARLAVRGEEHHYRPGLVADLGYTRTASPTLRGDGVSVGTMDDVTLGVGVDQEFAAGTRVGADLEVRGYRSVFVQPDLVGDLILGPGYAISLTLSATQPLLRGAGRDVGLAELRSARRDREAAEEERLRVASTTARDVLAAWWELWYAQEAARIQQKGLDVARRQLEDARKREAAGEIAPLDLLPLRTEVASVRESLIDAETTVRQRRVALARLVGTPPTGEHLVASAPGTPAVPSALPTDETVAERAREEAYEVAALRAGVRRARIAAMVAEDQAQPRLDASAWVTASGLGNEDPAAALEMWGSLGAVSAFTGLELELPLDRTELRSEAARARLAADTAQEDLREARERLAAQAVRQHDALGAAIERLEFAAETARLAAESARGQVVRFEAGAATALDVVIAEQERRRAELRVARAQADVAIGWAEVRHTTARLLGDVAPE
ncbi:MAG: TolC family protein [Myxococcota bacterium]